MRAKFSKFAGRSKSNRGLFGTHDVMILVQISKRDISSVLLIGEVVDPSIDRKFYEEYDGPH